MNSKTVKIIVESFSSKYFDNTIEEKEKMCEFLMESIQKLRREDLFLYEEVSSLSSIQRLSVLERILEMEYIPFDLATSVISSFMTNSLQEVLLKEEYQNDDVLSEYIIEDILEIFQKDFPELFKEGVFEDAASKAAELFPKLLKKIPTLSAVTIVPILALKSYIITSLIVVLGILIFTPIIDLTITRRFGINLQKEQIDIFIGIAGILNMLSKSVKDGTEGIKYRYALTFENEEKCYQRSGLDVNKLSLRHLLSIREGSNARYLLFGKEEERLDTLRNCYLEHFLDRISIFFDLYFDCLRKSGNWNSVKSLTDDKYIQLFRMKGEMYKGCDEYRANAVKAIRIYEDLVEFLFEKSPDLKSKWLLLLNRYILDTREPKDDQLRKHKDSYNSSKKPPWKGDKYRKLGADL